MEFGAGAKGGPGGKAVEAAAAEPNVVAKYFLKWRGEPGKSSPPRPKLRALLVDMGWSFLATIIAICALAALHYEQAQIRDTDKMMLIGSFGATAVLLYGTPSVPMAQPRNLVGGHVLGAFVGVSMRLIFKAIFGVTAYGAAGLWAACGLAVALSINIMQLTGTMHPPGGATALIAVMGGKAIHALGYWYVLMPALAGAVLMLVVALVVNNLAPTRRYPVYWW